MRIYGPFPQFSFVITVSFNLKEITPRLIRERIEVFGTEYLIEESQLHMVRNGIFVRKQNSV